MWKASLAIIKAQFGLLCNQFEVFWNDEFGKFFTRLECFVTLCECNKIISIPNSIQVCFHTVTENEKMLVYGLAHEEHGDQVPEDHDDDPKNE